jgi:hypothetical protein
MSRYDGRFDRTEKTRVSLFDGKRPRCLTENWFQVPQASYLQNWKGHLKNSYSQKGRLWDSIRIQLGRDSLRLRVRLNSELWTQL